MASKDKNIVTVVLGDEFDESLREKVEYALRKLEAAPFGKMERSVAGSQDLEHLEVVIDGRRLYIESETYIGLSISGPADLVEKVRDLILLG